MAQTTMPGLERLCRRDWVRSAPWQAGIQRVEAFFSGEAYAPHRHDTYSIGYTIRGVQRFDYRGARSDSTPGKVMVLHPDEIHNGEAGNEDGFHYRMIYIEPSVVREALGDFASSLPFVRDAVTEDPRLFHAIHAAFTNMDTTLEPLAFEEITTLLADGLLAQDPSVQLSRRLLPDFKAARLAREYLDANLDRVVSSTELAAETGQSRYAIARHFRKTYGTSPYRYLMMRRLDLARAAITTGASLSDVAITCGFSDQAHMSRCFKACYGLSPGSWQRLTRIDNRPRL